MSTHRNKLIKSQHLFSAYYEKVIICGDFNFEVNNYHMKFICENYGLKNLIRQPRRYKNPTVFVFLYV